MSNLCVSNLIATDGGVSGSDGQSDEEADSVIARSNESTEETNQAEMKLYDVQYKLMYLDANGTCALLRVMGGKNGSY